MDIFYLGFLRKQIALFIESKLGAPIEQIILVTTIASAIPFSFINYLIHNRNARLLYSLLIGLILQYSIYGINTLHTIFSTFTSYFFVYFFGRKISPFYLLIGLMIHLSYLNIKRMIEDYGGWAIDDISTIYMIMLTKYIAFAFCYNDGKTDPKNIKSEHHRIHRIEKFPNFFEYASYIYFYPTAVVGPFIEFVDFINFIDEKECYTNLKTKINYIFKEGLNKLLLALFFIGFYSTIGAWFPMTAVGKPQFRIDYPEWWQRILFMFIAGPGVRAKYYIGWLLSYSSLIFSGLAYGEIKKDGKIIQNVEKGSYGSIIYNEFGLHPKLKMVHWNRQIHQWLKYYIYTRLLTPLKNNKPLAQFVTYIFSSMWHGFYPTYYINFILIYFIEQGSLFLDEFGFYKFVDEHSFLWPIISLKTSLFNDSVGSFFYCLDSGSIKEILTNYYGYPANASIGFYIFSIMYRIIFMRKKKIKGENLKKGIEAEKKNKKIE
jgi:lysophospholipid acyltransferase